ncbi:MAG: hypothetical protein A2054_06615 [Deltaproteobacteria bacterium GWA2_55_10]|nr:MAG: hypothetical protein A2054_06615 [Deltaproteobacteria bacterium GWA2_55_10]
MAPLSLLMMLFAVSLAWAAWSLPGLIHITGSVAEACQTLFVRCVELLSIGKLFFFWSGALLVLSGVVYAAIKAASDIIKTNRAVSLLPVSRKGSRNLLIIENDGLKAAFTHGLLKPRIYISTGLMKCLSRDELRAVFLHELCHRDKLDPLRFLALGFLRNAFFYIPASGLLVSFSRLKSEHEADDAAVKSSEPVSLASAILKVARTSSALPIASLAGSQEQVTGRIKRLLEGRQPVFSISLSKALPSAAVAITLFAALSMPLYADMRSHECTMERCETHVDMVDNCRTHCETGPHVH